MTRPARHIVLAFAIAVVLLCSSADAQDEDDLQRLPNMNYVGQGYDILQGNPHPTASSGAALLDPGWRSPIFRLDFPRSLSELNSENTYLSNAVTYTVPSGVQARACPACSFEFQTTKVLSSSSYKDNLTVHFEADLKGWGATFKGSTDYKRVQQGYEEENSRYIESSASCTFYCARMNTFSPPALLDNFRIAVERLPVDFEPEPYYEFISEFGTHYSRGVTMGGLFGTQHEITNTAVRTLEDVGLKIDITARYASVTASGGAKLMTDSQKEQARNFSEATSASREFSYGGRPVFKEAINDTSGWLDTVELNPIPLHSELDMISNLLTDINFPEDGSIAMRQYNLVVALAEYCGRLETAGEIECADREFEVQVVGEAGAPFDDSRAEPNDPKLEANWDDGPQWHRMGQPSLTGVRMWFDEEGLATIQGVYARDNLFYHADPIDWLSAQATCLNEGSRMASIHNQAEFNHLRELQARLDESGRTPLRDDGTPERPYLGLNDRDREGLFLWEDGSGVSFQAWTGGQPDNAGENRNEDCVEYQQSSGGWNDLQCALQQPFFCQFPREHGTFPDSISTPLEFSMNPGEYISAVQVCDTPAGISSLQFTTSSTVSGGESISQVFSHGIVRERTECFTAAGYYEFSNEIFDDRGVTFLDWQSCQQQCLSDPSCTGWNYRLSSHGSNPNTCHTGVANGNLVSGGAHIGCGARECHDCSGDATLVVEDPDADCQTIEFSERLGLVHLSGANDQNSRLQSLAFHGFQEYALDYVPLELLPLPGVSAAPKSSLSPRCSVLLLLGISLASLV